MKIHNVTVDVQLKYSISSNVTAFFWAKGNVIQQKKHYYTHEKKYTFPSLQKILLTEQQIKFLHLHLLIPVSVSLTIISAAFVLL